MIPNLQLWAFFQGTQERVRNSRGKRAISVRATEVLLYMLIEKHSNGIITARVDRSHAGKGAKIDH